MPAERLMQSPIVSSMYAKGGTMHSMGVLMGSPVAPVRYSGRELAGLDVYSW